MLSLDTFDRPRILQKLTGTNTYYYLAKKLQKSLGPSYLPKLLAVKSKDLDGADMQYVLKVVRKKIFTKASSIDKLIYNEEQTQFNKKKHCDRCFIRRWWFCYGDSKSGYGKVSSSGSSIVVGSCSVGRVPTFMLNKNFSTLETRKVNIQCS